ncbi:MAG: hypothetical protein KJ630_02335 [Proteobacteria bacterium]|nr:hypothetical protein [Pseudomonadota bacterium]
MRRLSRMFAVFILSIVFLASCSAHIGDSSQSQAPLKTLSCIAVLPAATAFDKDEAQHEQSRSLEKGAIFATSIMARQLSGNIKARVVSADQEATLAPEVTGGSFGMVSAVGKKIGCDGVLVTTVRRFKQREGTEYASDDPASADLKMTLFHAASGAVLWTADFQETQESFFDNILSYDKMQNRGFKWVSVEHLVEQGITERLATCPYLK